jgi:hypothetical protein
MTRSSPAFVQKKKKVFSCLVPSCRGKGLVVLVVFGRLMYVVLSLSS